MSLATTTVSGANLCYANGRKVVSGTITWQPVSSITRQPISFRYGGDGGQTSWRPVSAPVANGAFNIVVADTSQTYPVNIGYKVTVTDGFSGALLLGDGYTCVQPTGASMNFDAYQPDLPAQVTVANVAGGSGGALFSQALTFSGPGTQTVMHGLNSTSLIVQGVITSGRATRWSATVVDANTLSVTALGAMVLDVIVMGGSSSSSSPGSGNPSTPVAPSITQQPSSASANSGSTITLMAAASGTPSPSVQWYTDSGSSGASWSAISGATSASYSFTAMSGHTGWQYRATFTNSAGSATTSTVAATVILGPAASWAMTEGSGATFIDSVAANNMAVGTPNWGTWNGVANAQLFGGSSFAFAQTATTPSCIATNTPWSIEGWMGGGAIPVAHQATFISNYNGTTGPGFEIAVPANDNGCFVALSGASGGLIYIHVANVFAAHTRYLVAVTYDGSGTAAGLKLYINGALQATTIDADTLGSQSITSTFPFTVAGNPQSSSLNSVGNQTESVYDHLIVYPYVRTLAQVQARFASGV